MESLASDWDFRFSQNNFLHIRWIIKLEFGVLNFEYFSESSVVFILHGL